MEAVNCPGCQRAVRVPADVLGQVARCPFCKCHFRAPVGTGDTLADPVLLRRNPFAGSPTFGPGALILFVGLLGVLTNVVSIAKSLSDPDGFTQKTRDDFDAMAERSDNPKLRDYGELTVKWLPRAHFAFLGLSALTVGAGVSMLRQRWHGLAMVGSFVALFNVANCCCLLGFPAGGWALFVLMNPEVRKLFGPNPVS